MRYLFHYIKHAPVYIALNFRAGALYESKPGTAHLTEHVIAQNTFAAQTSYGYMSFFAQDLSHSRSNTTKVLSDLMSAIKKPKVTQQSIDTERIAIKNELLNFSYDYPNTNQVVLHDYLCRQKKPVKNNELMSGNVNQPARTVSLRDVKTFIKKNLSDPDTVIVTGDFSKKLVRQLLHEAFPIQSDPHALSPMPIKRHHLIDPSKSATIATTYDGFGWAVQDTTEATRAKLLVAFHALANTDGELYRRLRADGLIYDIRQDASYSEGQFNLSLHTTSSGKSGKITESLLAFIQNRQSLLALFTQQTALEKSSFITLTDGSKTTFSEEYRLSQFGIDLDIFVKTVTLTSAEDIFVVFTQTILPETCVTVRS